MGTIALRLFLAVVAAGPIPKHVAFIPDGNRRYARSIGKPIPEGHIAGLRVLKMVYEVCLRLGVTCISGYFFAIKNFKRPQEQIDALLGLAEDSLVELCQPGGLLTKYDVRLNVVGRTELLPESFQKAIRNAESTTRDHRRAILNFYISYTSRDEMTTAIQGCVRNAINSAPNNRSSKFTEDDIYNQLQTTKAGSPPVDVLIRTGGDERLSNFLLWQCCENTQIHFVKPYWPQFGLFDFIPAILDYQIKVWQRG